MIEGRSWRGLFKSGYGSGRSAEMARSQHKSETQVNIILTLISTIVKWAIFWHQQSIFCQNWVPTNKIINFHGNGLAYNALFSVLLFGQAVCAGNAEKIQIWACNQNLVLGYTKKRLEEVIGKRWYFFSQICFGRCCPITGFPVGIDTSSSKDKFNVGLRQHRARADSPSQQENHIHSGTTSMVNKALEQWFSTFFAPWTHKLSKWTPEYP